jgi:hypothetical protein
MKVIALSVSLVLGAVIWWIAREDVTADTRTAAVPRSARTASPGRAAVDVRPALARRADAPASETAPLVDPAPRTAPETRPEISVAEQRTYLQDRFSAQSADPVWSSTARQELREDLGKLSSNDVRLQSVECRSSLCRAEFVLTSQEAGNTFLESWLRQRAWTGAGFAANDDTNPDSNRRLLLFLSRPGVALPYLE